jgi:transposase
VAAGRLRLGYKPEQVAELKAVSKLTIYGWIDRWHNDKVDGLANKPKSGRPAKADDEYSLAVDELLQKEPSELGYNSAILTIDHLRAHFREADSD